jgi:alpha-glucosidase
MEFICKKDLAGITNLSYKVFYKNKPVILESKMDIQIDNHLWGMALAIKPDTSKHWFDNLAFKDFITKSKDTTWPTVYGEQKNIRDFYNQTVIRLIKENKPDYEMHIVIRAYNEGIAFSYYFPENQQGIYFHINAENTQFSFPSGTKVWVARYGQAVYQSLPLEKWPDDAERLLTLKLTNGLNVCLAEARIVDNAQTKFKLARDKPNTIVTSLYSGVDLITAFSTPWRVIMVAEKPEDLIENNFIILNLNEPNKIKDVSWIEPGNVMRDVTISTENAISCVDFAVVHSMKYVQIDWQWYGPPFQFSSDASVLKSNLDLPKLIGYGRQKGIGIILYVNKQALLTQIDTIFPLYRKWGVKAVKFGFVEVGSHRWTVWLEEAIKKAAANKLMVIIHDEFGPTGKMRIFPNFMTAEGIRGNEEMPDAKHNTVLPFTRFVAGAANYRICYLDKRIKTTHAHQLALAAVYFSPMQSLYWYDRPACFQNEPELEFFDNIPTIWDETKVIQGEIGEYITTARRRNDQWFVGTITNNDGRQITIPFSFLTKGENSLPKSTLMTSL